MVEKNARLNVTEWLAPVPTRELVYAALTEVVDPELGVNIVDLGLVYDLKLDASGNVAVRMTLTTPGCPLGGYLDDEIHSCLRQFPSLGEVRVDLVFDPPWRPDLMSEAAKDQLGWRG